MDDLLKIFNFNGLTPLLFYENWVKILNFNGLTPLLFYENWVNIEKFNGQFCKNFKF